MFKKSSSLAALLTLSVLALPACGQSSTTTDYPDVPANHWAYQAVHSLADEGIVKGYPDGKFLGDRALTRYEFSALIVRILDTLKQEKAGQAGPAISQDDLNKIQVLVDEFKTELADTKNNVSQLQDDIKALRGQLDEVNAKVDATEKGVWKAQNTADNSYGPGSQNRKFYVSGYIQARDLIGASDNQSTTNGKPVFTNGKAGVYNPVNGTYMAGASSSVLEDRRSRLIFGGQVTNNTSYRVQFDANANSATVPVSVREGHVDYTFDNVFGAQPTLKAGIVPVYYGYQLPTVSATLLTPERPLAFSENLYTSIGLSGIFAGEDYDKGAVYSVPVRRTTGLVEVVTGNGFVSGNGILPATSTDHQVDEIYKLSYNAGPKLQAGATYDHGLIPDYGGTLYGNGDRGKMQLTDFDAEYKPNKNIFLNGEYESGPYEVRSYYSGKTQATLTANNPGTAAGSAILAPGNKIVGSSLQGGYVFHPEGRHAFTLGVGWDELERSASGVKATATNGGASGSSFDDVNVSYNVLYNLDPQTRLRLSYTDPLEVAHASSVGTVDPDKIGLWTTELQVIF